MRSLEGIVVNPFHCGLRLKLYLLDQSIAYGIDPQTDATMIVDVHHGYVMWEDYINANSLTLPEKLEKQIGQLSNEAILREYIKFQGGVDDAVLGIVSKIINQQVEADRFDTGLEALGIMAQPKVKLTNLYLGGWKFEQQVPHGVKFEEITLEELIHSLRQKN